ncbi:MAG: fluoride efflux transporter CrcB [Actinomycetales bacterium]|nr:fluoride efflux transporter CrcB [Actinomycetales bacterium]
MPTLLAIAVGGALGALGRFGIDEAMNPWAPGPWPWSTLLANVLGAFAIGLVATSRRVEAGPGWLRPFLITGVLGGFTTVSALALQTGLLIDTGNTVTGVAYLVLTFVLGFLAVRLAVLISPGGRS